MSKTSASPLPHAIVEARKEMIKNNRLAAIDILKAAIKKEKAPSISLQLQKELTHLSQIFLTNEGQKKFELAESSRHSGGTGFLPLYQQALKLEPDNTRVMVGYILGLLTSNECKQALAMTLQLHAIDSTMKPLPYLKFRAQLCVDPTVLTKTDDADLKRSHFSRLYRKIARAEEEFDRGNMKSALKFSQQAIKADNNFPQSYYWAFKALSAKAGGISEGERYLYLCRTVTAQTRRRYTYEPQLCVHTDDVQQAIKAQEAQKHEAN